MKTNFIKLFTAFILLETTTAITLTNIWQSLKITNPSVLNRPQDIRTATVGWKIDTDNVLANDIFFFLMPYVFRTKFDSVEILLKADEIVYARCKVNDGSFNSDISYLKCTMTSSVDEKKGVTAIGEIQFDFVFNAGGSSSDSDILCAKRFDSGNNQISFSNMQSNVNFQSGPFFTDKKTDELLYYSRSTPQDLEQVFVLSGTCNGGITSGSMVFTTNNSVDCSQFKLKITNDLNDFYLPRSYKSVDVGSIRCSTDNKKLTVTFNNIPSGYRVFLEGFEKYPDNSDYVKHLYAENIKCGDGSSKVDGVTKIIRVIDGLSSSDGSTEVSSSIQLSSSLEMTSTLGTSSSCNQSTIIPTTDTETTLNTNTVTETVCTECARATSNSADSPTTESLTTELSSNSSGTARLSTTSKTTSEAPETTEWNIELLHETETISYTETTLSSSIQTETETDISVNSATETISCHNCASSSLLSTSVPPTIGTTETMICQNCSSSSILSTSIPPAIGTTETTATTISSKYVSCVECMSSQTSHTSQFVLSTTDTESGTSTCAEPVGTENYSLCSNPLITENETISETITCKENCTTTFPTYVPDISSSEFLHSEHSNILPNSSTVESSNTQPQSGVAETSIASLSTIASTTIISASPSTEYSSSSPYISPYTFSSYEAFSYSKGCSWTMLLCSFLALLV